SDLPVVFAGFVNQLEFGPVHASVDALVLASDRSETWGLVANEAMACGLPVIASDQCGCANDLVIDDLSGCVYPCGDVERLATCMDRMGDAGLRKQWGDAAQRRVVQYSVETTRSVLVESVLGLS
ncbi:glycosyltransferase family 4 protein, partial [Gammaproteobacteria bacterium]|nr:glycosyltransferase family 4 protein [Gammaproteobacteria bacterium]